MPEAAIDYELLAHALMQQIGGSQQAQNVPLYQQHSLYPGPRFKAVSSTPSTIYGHGNGGLFSAPGMDRQVFSAMILPYMGLMSHLPPASPSRDTNPLYGILTGQTAATGSHPTGVCDDPKTAGLLKLCETSLPFGRVSLQTRVFDIDEFGRRTNRGEYMDYQLIGSPFVNNPAGAGMPTVPGASIADALNSDIAKALTELAVDFSREFARMIFTGDTVNNTAGGGHKEFWGLETLINTGYRHAETGVACPAADSTVFNFGSLNIETNGALFVSRMQDMHWRLTDMSARMGLSPARWAIVMPLSMFYLATAVWPCSYMTNRCTVPTGSTNFVDSGDAVRMRDEMRGDLENYTGQFLWLNGQRVPVVIDTAIPETETSPGVFSATVYFVPLTVKGNIRVTYMEYFDYTAENGAIEAARIMAGAENFFVSDGGRWLWARKPPTNWCVQMMAKTQPRLVLRTPQIAGRIDNVVYSPTLHERSWDPTSGYFADGGATSRQGYGPSFYSPTS